MKIENPTKSRIVYDYDFFFIGGGALAVYIDFELGDTVKTDPDTITLKRLAKPSLADPDLIIPEQTNVIYTKNLAYSTVTPREITELTPEQQQEWKKTMQELGAIQ